MITQRIAILLFSSVLLTGCLSDVWTAATLVYDRHSVYKTIDDFQLAANASRALYKDMMFKRGNCTIDLAIFNGDILIAGIVATDALRQEAYDRLVSLRGYRRIFNQLAVSKASIDPVQDDWITTKIRSKIFSDSTIDPHSFKVVTCDRIVYLMGDVIPAEATRVIHIARKCTDVKRVVKLFKYYNLTDRPLKSSSQLPNA